MFVLVFLQKLQLTVSGYFNKTRVLTMLTVIISNIKAKMLEILNWIAKASELKNIGSFQAFLT